MRTIFGFTAILIYLYIKYDIPYMKNVNRLKNSISIFIYYGFRKIGY
jgi:hypothetical protein